MKRNDFKDLLYARELLENPGFAIRLANELGAPIEAVIEKVPEKITGMIHSATHKSLQKILDCNAITMDATRNGDSSEAYYKLANGVVGAGGGFFGLKGLILELPLSTGIIMRSIMDIARNEGENIDDIETRLNCLSVFALGGNSSKDDASEIGYFEIRTAMAQFISDAVRYVAEQGLSNKNAPVLIRLITKIASRFEIILSEKAVAQAIPIIGAAGGAVVNTVFTNHYQDMARGHFIIVRLEKKYGEKIVRKKYDNKKVRK